MWSYNPSCDSRAPTYWWRFERVFVRKIYSHLPHASLVRCCTRRGHKKKIMREHGRVQRRDFHSTEHHIPSFMHSSGSRYSRVISVFCTPFSSSQKDNRERATWEMSHAYHFPMAFYFILFYAVMYFSPGEFFTSKSLHIIHWHQRGGEWDCEYSPRIAV